MFDWNEVSTDLVRLAVAFLLTEVIGWNREREEHNTGIRAFPIVGMASCGYLLILGQHPDASAQSRVLQGLITGIGFVGGGAILKQGSRVRGTATAASIWNAGVIGAAVAMDKYAIAVILTVFNLIVLRALLPLKKRLNEKKAGTRGELSQ